MKKILDRFPINDLVPSYVEIPTIDGIARLKPSNPERFGTIRILMLLNYKPFIEDLKIVDLSDPLCLLAKWKVQIILAMSGDMKAIREQIYCETLGVDVEEHDEQPSIKLIDRMFGVTSVFGGGVVPEGFQLIAVPLMGTKTEILAAVKAELKNLKGLPEPVRGGKREIYERIILVRYGLDTDGQLSTGKIAQELISTSPVLRAASVKNKADALRNMLESCKKIISPS